MTRQEIIEKRLKLNHDAHAIMSKKFEDITTEDRVAADKMYADSNLLKADLERLTNIEAEEAENRSKPGVVARGEVANNTTTDTRNWEEKRAATGVALRAAL